MTMTVAAAMVAIGVCLSGPRPCPAVKGRCVTAAAVKVTLRAALKSTSGRAAARQVRIQAAPAGGFC